MPRHTLETERLILRPFALGDAPRIKELAGEFEIADTTLLIPHPYELSDAESWIATHEKNFEEKISASFALVEKKENFLIGAMGLHCNFMHERAEVGYWIGRPFWNMGYASEALKEIIRYGFENFSLNKIFAEHFSRNPASGRVMQKAGMKHEARLRQHIKKWSRYEDVEFYSILREEFFSEE